MHFDTKLTRRSGDESTAPARDIGQPGAGISSPKTAGTVSGIIGELEQCDEYITPICLRTLYGLFYEPVCTDKNSFGIGQWMFLQNESELGSYTIHSLLLLYSGVYPPGLSAERSADVCPELFDRSYWQGTLFGFDRRR